MVTLIDKMETENGVTAGATSNDVPSNDAATNEVPITNDVPMNDAPTNEGTTNDAAANTTPTPAVNSLSYVDEHRKDKLEITDPQTLQKQIEARAKGYLAQQLYRVIIPSFAAWYDRNKIDDIEKKSLPEFFNHKNRTKTPTIYKEFRDFMIDAYRLNPIEYLTVTACRRNLAGDVCSIMRVHSFLEQWGLINYQVDPETRPSLIGPQFTGHFQITLDTPKGLQPFVPIKRSTVSEGKELDMTEKKMAASNDLEDTMVNLELRKHVYDNGADAAALLDDSQRKYASAVTRVYNCYTTGEDVSKLRYHNLQSKQCISALCFKNGLFPSNYQSSDYIRIEQSQAGSSTWSDQETLLLLEGIEMYEDDWDSIAYHVGTRNKEACITKFLQMPIEDPYLVKNVDSDKINGSGGDGDTKKLESSIAKALDSLRIPSSNALTERAKALINQKDEQLSSLISSLVEAQLRKVELKLKRFEDLELVLHAERQEIEKAKLQVYLDRLSLKSQAESVLAKLREATTLSGQEAIDLAAEAVQLAARNPKSALVANEVELKQGSKVADPQLRPISLDTPQTYKFWSA